MNRELPGHASRAGTVEGRIPQGWHSKHFKAQNLVITAGLYNGQVAKWLMYLVASVVSGHWQSWGHRSQQSQQSPFCWPEKYCISYQLLRPPNLGCETEKGKAICFLISHMSFAFLISCLESKPRVKHTVGSFPLVPLNHLWNEAELHGLVFFRSSGSSKEHRWTYLAYYRFGWYSGLHLFSDSPGPSFGRTKLPHRIDRRLGCVTCFS